MMKQIKFWLFQKNIIYSLFFEIFIISFKHYKVRGVFEKKQDCANNYCITNINLKLQHVSLN